MSIILMAIFVALAAAAKPPPNPYPIVGNTADVAATLNLGGPVYDLGGGGYDVDMAFQRTIDLVRGCTGSSCATKIDVVIVRATGTDAYNPYIYSMNGVDSCQTLIVSSVTQASDPLVDAAIRGAEFVFFAGGDQCDYVTYYKVCKDCKICEI